MKNFIYLLLIVAIGFASCRKEPDYDKLSSEFIVSTNLDKTASFGSYKTYYMADTVINLGGTGKDTILNDANAVKLVAAVKSNMASRGYTLVARTAKPDLGLRLGVVKVVNVDVYYPGWWDGYAGWFPYWWGGYYPYYYPWTTVYTYNTGTEILDVYDLKNAKTNGQYRVIWNVAAFGALGSDMGGNLNRGINAINQGFVQSPYFKAN
ncbi:DUF4136 domain-containing protein [Mucilaginibacter agri]|uniref:DUF4136 domain-containing protein n=1 Tax=Mucilaginibacter agri TaxID=2695265 RepID=A0A965ZKI4_9SPHI|nr:DUF4136 domain-containing protein [Mucilaginibacter agri]NCD72365.1 DUF4136 domain-containing protein [Mucilaginibacter agri]